MAKLSKFGELDLGLKSLLTSLRMLTNGYPKHLRTRKKLVIAGANGQLLVFDVRRKEELWIELGPHEDRRPKGEQKNFPGRFSLLTGESLDGFDGWCLVADTPENFAAARAQKLGRMFRDLWLQLPDDLRDDYADRLVPREHGRGRRAPNLDEVVSPFLRMSRSEQNGLLRKMKDDCRGFRP